MDHHGLGAGPLEARLIGDGQFNVTIQLSRGSVRYVLRRPPRPPFQPTAHDVLREARIQQALRVTAAPVPEIVLVHSEPDLLGVPFYIPCDTGNHNRKDQSMTSGALAHPAPSDTRFGDPEFIEAYGAAWGETEQLLSFSTWVSAMRTRPRAWLSKGTT
jgi:hypothetical protein